MEGRRGSDGNENVIDKKQKIDTRETWAIGTVILQPYCIEYKWR